VSLGSTSGGGGGWVDLREEKKLGGRSGRGSEENPWPEVAQEGDIARERLSMNTSGKHSNPEGYDSLITQALNENKKGGGKEVRVILPCFGGKRGVEET